MRTFISATAIALLLLLGAGGVHACGVTFAERVETQKTMSDSAVRPRAAISDWSVQSDQARSGFGFAVASAGDVNSDGFDDVIVGAPYYDGVDIDSGRVYLYPGSDSGPAGSPTWSFDGNGSDLQFGYSVSGAGDVNGDGYDDIVVGVPLYGIGTTDEGAAFVFLGSASGPSATPDWVASSGRFSTGFGGSVAGAGDVNGDGFSDVIVGAPGYSDSVSAKGQAYLYLGSPSGLSSTPAWTAQGAQAEAFFGASVASAGDINGDGFSDVIVGAPGFVDSRSRSGRAYVFLGSRSGPGRTPVWTAYSDQAYARFGSVVNSAGDVNHDGYDDVIVGAPSAPVSEASSGHAYVYLGSASGPRRRPAWTAVGSQHGNEFGNSVAGAGDVNGDGYDDIIVGEDRFENGEYSEGRVGLYLGSATGPETTTIWSAEGGAESAGLGASLASGVDVNGDGFHDVLAGAPGMDSQLVSEGRVHAYLCLDGDNDGICLVDDNCPRASNSAQSDTDQDGSGDACDLTILNPLEGDILDCSSGAAGPTIQWDPYVYDAYRVQLSWAPGFQNGKRSSSGNALLTTTSWTVPAKIWKHLCRRGQNIYIRVLGWDFDAGKGSPARRDFSATLTVQTQR